MAAIFTDDIFKCIFTNEKFMISIQISLKLVSNGSIDNTSALFPVMAWRRTGDEPLPEPMLIQFIDAYMRYSMGWVTGQIPMTTILCRRTQILSWHPSHYRFFNRTRNCIKTCDSPEKHNIFTWYQNPVSGTGAWLGEPWLYQIQLICLFAAVSKWMWLWQWMAGRPNMYKCSDKHSD